MTSNAYRALNSYSAMEIEAGVANASPARLVVMLYEGALKAVFAAKAAMVQGDTPGKGSSISKAIAIIDEGLRPALDLDAGGEVAGNLAALYHYISGRLLYANLKNDTASLDEATRLLSELKSAWDTLEQRERPAVQPAAAPEPAERRAPTSFGKA